MLYYCIPAIYHLPTNIFTGNIIQSHLNLKVLSLTYVTCLAGILFIYHTCDAWNRWPHELSHIYIYSFCKPYSPIYIYKPHTKFMEGLPIMMYMIIYPKPSGATLLASRWHLFSIMARGRASRFMHRPTEWFKAVGRSYWVYGWSINK